MKLPLLKKMNEAAWLLGIVFCALGVCLLTKAGFGLSMVSAAAYILHLRVVQFLPFFFARNVGICISGGVAAGFVFGYSTV